MSNKYEQKFDRKLDSIFIFFIIIATFVFSVTGFFLFHPSISSDPSDSQKAIDSKDNGKLKTDPTFEPHIPRHIMQPVSDVGVLTDIPKPHVKH